MGQNCASRKEEEEVVEEVPKKDRKKQKPKRLMDHNYVIKGESPVEAVFSFIDVSKERLDVILLYKALEDYLFAYRKRIRF